MAMYNAIVTLPDQNGYIVTTQIGITGVLKTDKQLFPGDYVNVDILGKQTIEFKSDFWGPEFKMIDSYVDFWNKTWKEKYDINDMHEESFTIKVGDELKTIHKDFNILFSRHTKKNIDFYDPVSFSSAKLKSSFKNFKKCIDLGVCKKEVEITFTYNFLNLPFETSLFKVLLCHVPLIDDLK